MGLQVPEDVFLYPAGQAEEICLRFGKYTGEAVIKLTANRVYKIVKRAFK